MAEHKRMETDNVLDKKAQQLMEDRDAESRTRVFEGTLNKVFTVVRHARRGEAAHGAHHVSAAAGADALSDV